MFHDCNRPVKKIHFLNETKPRNRINLIHTGLISDFYCASQDTRVQQKKYEH